MKWLQMRCCSKRNAPPPGSFGRYWGRVSKVVIDNSVSRKASGKVAGPFWKTLTLVLLQGVVLLAIAMVRLVPISRLREHIYVAVVIILGLCSGCLALEIHKKSAQTDCSNSLKNV